MRVLPQVERASFDIPTETFAIDVKGGADTAPILAAIKGLGFTPEVLDAAPTKQAGLTRLDAPTSAALREALARAKARGVPLVIDFGGPFCHLCRKFEETALKDEQVRQALGSFEFLQVDIESDSDAAKDLDVHAVPDIWVFGGAGTMLARHNGYLSPTEFLAFLKAAPDPD